MSIYRLNYGELYYYGSTIEDLEMRLKSHRCQYANGSLSCMSRELFINAEKEGGKVKIELIETLPKGFTKRQREEREAFYIKSNECVNKLIPYRTKADYAQYYKEWAKDKKKQLSEYQKAYREKNKQKLREKKREYRMRTREYKLKKDKEYYEKNKHLKVMCDYCDKEYRKWNFNAHEKTKTHMNNMITSIIYA